MKTKEPLTKVIFRIERTKDGEVCALFPAIAGTVGKPSHCSAYVHMGQHTAASMDYVRRTRLAKPAEYRELAAELRRIGYRLKIARRFHPSDRREREKQLAQ